MTTATRPEWAGTTAYAAAFTGLRRHEQMRLPDHQQDAAPAYAALLSDARSGMASSRVIRVPCSQVEALPLLDEATWAGFLGRARLPFPVVFLDLDGATFDEDLCQRDEHGRDVGFVAGGVLLSSLPAEDDVISALVFLQRHTRAFPVGFMTASRSEGVVAWPDPLTTSVMKDAWNDVVQLRDRPHPPYVLDPEYSLRKIVERAASVLMLLESSNVELVDVPLTRQVRRAAERDQAKIALTVKIRIGRRQYRSPLTDAERRGGSQWSHRREVRGHFKHYGPGTRIFDAASAEKVMRDDERGEHVRVWCPSFVQGPEDKPLIPKRREVVA